jgi:hypothetical protein
MSETHLQTGSYKACFYGFFIMAWQRGKSSFFLVEFLEQSICGAEKLGYRIQ